MKIITYNVNGIRAALRKGFAEWLKTASPDVICIQELKAQKEQVDWCVFEDLGYNVFTHSAIKKGYSGVAILSKLKPDNVVIGCGNKKIDEEGRVLRADFNGISVLSTYFPSGSSRPERQDFKMEFLGEFGRFIENLKTERPNLIISGDFNICHKPIDIHNPIRNVNSPGFLPEERAWMDSLLELGFCDAFRINNSEPHQYTWWSYRANARAKNLGWRIDYHVISSELKNKVKRAQILSRAKHSDHCPLILELD